MLRTLGYRFERTFTCCTRRWLFTLPSTACSALAFALRWRGRKNVQRRTAEFPWNASHQLDI
jgi:hypothetical protein